MQPLFSRRPALSLCHFTLVTHLGAAWPCSSHIWGLLLMSQTKSTNPSLLLPFLGSSRRRDEWEPNAVCLQFSSICCFLHTEGWLCSLASQTKPREGFCLVVSEGASLAVAPFAQSYTYKTTQNYCMQTSLPTTWRCIKTTLFNLNRFLDFNCIYRTSALSVCCSFWSTHLPLHLYFMKILEFGHFCCCPAVV